MLLSVLVVTNVEPDGTAPSVVTNTLWERLAIGLIAFGFLAGWTYILHCTLFKNRRSKTLPPVLVVSCAAISGIVFASSITFGLMLFDIVTPQSYLERIIFTTLIAIWWGLTLQLLLEARWRFITNRDALIEQAVQMETARMQEVEIIANMRSAIDADVDAGLASARLEIDLRLAAASDDLQQTQWTTVAQSLRDTAQDAVRPISKKLWIELSDQYPRPPVRDAFKNIINCQPFRPIMVSLLYLVSTAPSEIHTMGPAIGSLLVLFSVLSILIIMSLANMSMRWLPRWHAVIFLSTVALIQIIGLITAPIRASLGNYPSDLGRNIAEVVISLVIIFTTSGFGTLRTTNEDLLRTFRSDIDEDRIASIARSRKIAELAREASRVLHGVVQTKLISCAIAIDKACAAGDSEQFNRSLLQARAVLEQPISTAPPTDDLSIRESVELKCDPWIGLCEFTIVIDKNIESVTGPVATDVGRVIEEGVANAVRHGNADKLSVAVNLTDSDQVRVVLSDNGNGLMTGSPGLGTALMQRVGNGSVQLVERSDTSGVILTIDISWPKGE